MRARRTQGKADDSVVKLRPVCRASCPPTCAAQGVRGRGRCDAGRLRLLGSTAGQDARREGEGGNGRPAVREVALRQETAGLPRGARPRGRLPRRPVDPRTHHRDEAEVLAPRATTAGWSPSCGSIPTARASSSCPPRPPRPRRSRSPPNPAFLDQRGVNLTGEQQTKTKSALEFFSPELRGGPDGSRATHPSRMIARGARAAPTLGAGPSHSRAARAKADLNEESSCSKQLLIVWFVVAAAIAITAALVPVGGGRRWSPLAPRPVAPVRAGQCPDRDVAPPHLAPR